jgi:hypothetical protein
MLWRRDDGFGKGVWRLLGQVVTDAARDVSVLILAGEFLRVSLVSASKTRADVSRNRPGRVPWRNRIDTTTRAQLWGQWQLAGFLAPDQVTADGNKRFDALRPQRRNDVGLSAF